MTRTAACRTSKLTQYSCCKGSLLHSYKLSRWASMSPSSTIRMSECNDKTCPHLCEHTGSNRLYSIEQAICRRLMLHLLRRGLPLICHSSDKSPLASLQAASRPITRSPAGFDLIWLNVLQFLKFRSNRNAKGRSGTILSTAQLQEEVVQEFVGSFHLWSVQGVGPDYSDAYQTYTGTSYSPIHRH